MEQRNLPPRPKDEWDVETQRIFGNSAVFYNLLCDIRQKNDGPRNTFTNTVFVMLTELAFDHHAAILKLVEGRVLISSAFALVRPLMETVGRAIWVYRRGEEQKLKHVLKTPGCDLPDYAAMSLAVDAEITALGAGSWFTLPKAHLKELHSLTHSGKAALQMRINSEGIVAPSYQAEAIQRLLRHTTSFAALNGIIYSQAAAGLWEETSEDAKLIADRFQELFA